MMGTQLDHLELTTARHCQVQMAPVLCADSLQQPLRWGGSVARLCPRVLANPGVVSGFCCAGYLQAFMESHHRIVRQIILKNNFPWVKQCHETIVSSCIVHVHTIPWWFMTLFLLTLDP